MFLYSNTTDYLLHEEEYYNQIQKKDVIVLHHTAGGHRADYTIGGWEVDKNTKGLPLRVGTAFVVGGKSTSTIDKEWDGKILRAFDDKYWAHHLGTKLANNEYLNKKSIGIEICNYGPVTKTKDGKFLSYVNRELPPSDVVELKEMYKGYKLWHRYTDKQLNNTKLLLLELANNHSIDLKKNSIEKSWFELNTKATAGDSGLWTHTSYRTDKFDLFPQDELIDMLKSL